VAVSYAGSNDNIRYPGTLLDDPFIGFEKFEDERYGFGSKPLRGFIKKYRCPTLKPKVSSTDGSPASCVGYVTASPAQKYYHFNQDVTVTAVPQTGYRFYKWKGTELAYECGGNLDFVENITSPCVTITMEAEHAHSLEAVFTPVSWQWVGDWPDNPGEDAWIYINQQGVDCANACCGEIYLKQWALSRANNPLWNNANSDQSTWHVDLTDANGWYVNTTQQGQCMSAMTDNPHLWEKWWEWILTGGGGKQWFNVEAYCCQDGADFSTCKLVSSYQWFSTSEPDGDVVMEEGWPEPPPEVPPF